MFPILAEGGVLKTSCQLGGVLADGRVRAMMTISLLNQRGQSLRNEIIVLLLYYNANTRTASLRFASGRRGAGAVAAILLDVRWIDRLRRAAISQDNPPQEVSQYVRNKLSASSRQLVYVLSFQNAWIGEVTSLMSKWAACGSAVAGC